MGSSFSLPERALVRLASFLSVKDIVNVSQTSVLLNTIGCDNKVWRQACLRLGWGGRITSTHAVRKKWKEVYIQHVMLARQRRLQVEVAKPSLLRGPKKLYVLVLGLDRVGKTTFVYRLKLNRKIVSIPTVGANRESVTKPFPVSKPGTQPLERVFKFTDVGGITPMRLLWSEYLRVETKKIDAAKIDVLAFMVDASDPDRVPLAAAELQRCVNLLGGSKPVIVLASKFDVHRAFSANQLCEKLRLRELFEKKKTLWSCQSISNVTGMGLNEALDWMIWSQNPTSDSECWMCRSQDVEESALILCGKCKHKHCPSCMSTSKTPICKFCLYCLRS